LEGDEGAEWIWAALVGIEGCGVKMGLFEVRMDADAIGDTILFACAEDI